MIAGQVDSLNLPLLLLTLRGPYGHATVEVMVDTGYTGNLSLPRSLIQRLGLPRVSRAWVHLADGRMTASYLYQVEVEWVSGPVTCVALENQISDCLLGRSLLDNHALSIDFGPAKTVEVR